MGYYSGKAVANGRPGNMCDPGARRDQLDRIDQAIAHLSQALAAIDEIELHTAAAYAQHALDICEKSRSS